MKAVLFLLLFFFTKAHSQSAGLPVSAYKGSPASKTLFFYISGDGGLNNFFSRTFMQQFRQQGLSIIGMSSKSYFWSKKTPAQAAWDIGNVINAYLKKWNCQDFVLIGYSFGADVAPFIQMRFSSGLGRQAKHIILMSPSQKTDFEIHLLSSLGFYKNKGLNVPNEINKLTVSTTLIFGSNEKDFPIESITAKNVKIIRVPGSHHYEWNVAEVVKQITNAAK